MDFAPAPTVEKTRTEFRAWLRENLPDRAAWKCLENSDDVPARIAFLKAWQRKLYEARWVAVHWPAGNGGRGGSLLRHPAVPGELLRPAGAPRVQVPLP